jgi:hypothetical protein
MATENTGINWSRILRRNEHGVADVAATLAVLEGEIRAHIVANEIPQEQIRAAVLAVFDECPTTQFDLGSLTTRVLAQMKVVPGTETKVGKSVANFVRGESRQVEQYLLGNSEAPGIAVVSRGKGGGVKRATPEYIEKARKARAEKNAE